MIYDSLSNVKTQVCSICEKEKIYNSKYFRPRNHKHDENKKLLKDEDGHSIPILEDNNGNPLEKPFHIRCRECEKASNTKAKTKKEDKELENLLSDSFEYKEMYINEIKEIEKHLNQTITTKETPTKGIRIYNGTHEKLLEIANEWNFPVTKLGSALLEISLDRMRDNDEMEFEVFKKIRELK